MGGTRKIRGHAITESEVVAIIGEEVGGGGSWVERAMVRTGMGERALYRRAARLRPATRKAGIRWQQHEDAILVAEYAESIDGYSQRAALRLRTPPRTPKACVLRVAELRDRGILAIYQRQSIEELFELPWNTPDPGAEDHYRSPWRRRSEGVPLPPSPRDLRLAQDRALNDLRAASGLPRLEGEGFLYHAQVGVAWEHSRETAKRM